MLDSISMHLDVSIYFMLGVLIQHKMEGTNEYKPI